MTAIRVDDHATRADLAEALANVNARAKRIPHVLGTEALPTEWDRRHETLDALLTDWQQAPS